MKLCIFSGFFKHQPKTWPKTKEALLKVSCLPSPPSGGGGGNIIRNVSDQRGHIINGILLPKSDRKSSKNIAKECTNGNDGLNRAFKYRKRPGGDEGGKTFASSNHPSPSIHPKWWVGGVWKFVESGTIKTILGIYARGTIRAKNIKNCPTISDPKAPATGQVGKGAGGEQKAKETITEIVFHRIAQLPLLVSTARRGMKSAVRNELSAIFIGMCVHPVSFNLSPEVAGRGPVKRISGPFESFLFLFVFV